VNEDVTWACSAILKLHEQVIKWPRVEERKTSAEEFERCMVSLIVLV